MRQIDHEPLCGNDRFISKRSTRVSAMPANDPEALGEQLKKQQDEHATTESALQALQAEVKRLQEQGVKGDLNAIFQQIQRLHDQNKNLQEQIQIKQDRIGRLEHKTQEEMNKHNVNEIDPWLEALPGLDPASREKVKKGLKDLIDLAAQDSGVWQVMCCASAAHQQSVTRLEQLQRETSELREKVSGGHFGGDSQRMSDAQDISSNASGKRKHNVISTPETSDVKLGVWDDFEVMMKRENGVRVE